MTQLADTARTDPDAVKEIIETSLEGEALNPFINMAHYLVNEKLGPQGIPLPLLGEIERWLAAHYVAIYDPRVQQESVGGEWSATYQGKTGQGLAATTYGQQALIADYTGTLAALGQQGIIIKAWSEYD